MHSVILISVQMPSRIKIYVLKMLKYFTLTITVTFDVVLKTANFAEFTPNGNDKLYNSVSINAGMNTIMVIGVRNLYD